MEGNCYSSPVAKRQSRKTGGGCKRSVCPIANVLDLVGDKWTLLIVRDLLFMGKRRYREFVESPEGIPTNILADRLKRLEAGEFVTKAPYQTNPPRYTYSLTPKGADLKSVLLAMIAWSGKHVPGARKPPAKFMKGM